MPASFDPADVPTPGVPAGQPHRSKATAGLLALALGVFGMHRRYLRASWWWLYPIVSLPLIGHALRQEAWYREPTFFAWVLLFVICCGEAIAISLTPDDRWDARHNAASATRSRSGWPSVVIAILGLSIGVFAMMATLALALESAFS